MTVCPQKLENNLIIVWFGGEEIFKGHVAEQGGSTTSSKKGQRNRLPREAMHAPSLAVFKARLDRSLSNLI